ncbi:MAG: RNA polymerase sigma factor [Paucibacter sp.]|nr:RNA polymerase sigma factor [Roseateles sp.]
MNSNLNTLLNRIRSALVRRGRSVQDAEDLVHEAWVRMASYQQEQVVERPEAFLMRTALNLSIDAHRTSVSHGESVLLEEVVLVDASPAIEDVLLARERLARLSICLGRLSEKSRSIFLAHRVDGLTYREIADRHDLSITTVEKHIAKASLQLTTWMEGW